VRVLLGSGRKREASFGGRGLPTILRGSLSGDGNNFLVRGGGGGDKKKGKIFRRRKEKRGRKSRLTGVETSLPTLPSPSSRPQVGGQRH